MDTRNRLSRADWEIILAEQAKSGLSAKLFCLERGIKPTSYCSATKRQRLALAMATAADLSVRKTSPARDLTTGTATSVPKRATFVSIAVSDELGQAHREDPAIRVQLRGGHQFWVGAGFDAAHLGRLVALLELVS